MDIISKYQTPQFLEFFARYKFPDFKSKHTASTAMSYYRYAYYQFLSHTDNYVAFFKERNPSHDQVMAALRISWSYAFGMYVHLRTTIDSLRIMRQMISDTTAIDIYYKQNIKRICDIANDMVKHPTFKYSLISEACEPQALEMNGEIDIVSWSENGQYEGKESLNPSKDFDCVHDYMEYLGNKLLGITLQ